MLTTVLGIVAPLFGLIALGWFAGRRGLLPKGATPALNSYLVWLALPALFFRVLAESDPRPLWQPGFLIAFCAGCAVAFLLPLFERGRSHRTLSEKGLDALLGSYPNTGYMGIPLAAATFGVAGTHAAILACVVPVAIVFALGIMLIEFDLHREHGLSTGLRMTARQLATNPLILSPMLGLCWQLAGLPIPEAADKMLELLGQSAAPCALVNIGLFLSEAGPISGAHRLAPLVAVKLLVQPAVTAVVALWFLDMPRLWANAAILLAALPSGTGPFMLATHYGLDNGRSAQTILISTILSLVTLTLLLMQFG